MDIAISNGSTNLTQFISEALASATSSIIGAATAELPSTVVASTVSSTGGVSSWTSGLLFGYPFQRLFGIQPSRSTLARTRRMASTIDGLSIICLIAIVFVICLYIIHIIAFLYSKYRLHRRVESDSNLPGVSIIKPIVGRDANLRENLESFFVTNYHKFELLFCFHSENDSGVELVKSLMRKHPKIETKLFFNGENVGLNPKINNMMPAYRAAKYPLLLISDSGIYMKPDALLDMAVTMESHEKMALVTQVPYCKDRHGFAAAFEQIFFGTNHGRIYVAGNCMEFVCSTGMSSMMRKDALDECGGIAAFGMYLAEDYFFGRKLADLGYKSAISSYPALQNSHPTTVLSFLERICRWIKLRIAMLPHIILVEPLQDCFITGFMISTCLKYMFGINPYVTFTLHVLYWITMDYMLINSIQNSQLNYSVAYFVAVWILRELSAPFVFLVALCQPTIRWRNNRFKLAWGGKIIQK